MEIQMFYSFIYLVFISAAFQKGSSMSQLLLYLPIANYPLLNSTINRVSETSNYFLHFNNSKNFINLYVFSIQSRMYNALISVVLFSL